MKPCFDPLPFAQLKFLHYAVNTNSNYFCLTAVCDSCSSVKICCFSLVHIISWILSFLKRWQCWSFSTPLWYRYLNNYRMGCHGIWCRHQWSMFKSLVQLSNSLAFLTTNISLQPHKPASKVESSLTLKQNKQFERHAFKIWQFIIRICGHSKLH